jgi:hypothetical protein
VGFFPVFFPPEGCLGHAPVHAHERPVDALQTVVVQQASLPQGEEDAGLDPFLKAVVGGGTGAEAGGVQGLPLAAGTEAEEDSVHTNAVGSPWPAAAKAMGVGMFGEQPGDLLPQVIGDAPLIGDRFLGHDQVSEVDQLSTTQVQLHNVIIANRGLSG